MPRVHVVSDLHLDAWTDRRGRPHPGCLPPVPACDLVVVAGDTDDDGPRGVRALAGHYAAAGVPLAVVAGNHDGFGGTYPRYHEKMVAVAQACAVEHPHWAPVHVLEQQAAIVAGVRVVGATLWTDFALHPEGVGVGMAAAGDPLRGMREYRRVRVRTPDGYRRLRPTDTAAIHARTVAWLRETLATPALAGIPTVVVTHHPAIPAALTPAQAADPCVGADASDLTALVAASGAVLWVSGHTHQAMDIVIGGTRCVSNPRGRQGEATDFRSDCVIEAG